MINMEFNISKVTIKRIPENKWHIWFASCIVNDWIKLNNIAIFKRLNRDWYRLVFPEKKIWENKPVQIFFPINSDAYFILEEAICKQLEDHATL